MAYWSKVLGLNRKELTIVNCVLLLFGVYPGLLFGASLFGITFLPLFPISLIIILTHLAYIHEIKSATNEDFISFRDDSLFLKYGKKINSNIFPLKIPKDQELFADKSDVVEDLLPEMETELKNQIDYNLRVGKQHSTQLVEVYNEESGELRDFLKFSFEGKKGAMITHFIYLQIFGSYLTLHFHTFKKGIPHWYDRLYFYLTSPFKFIFWIIPWIRRQYSILTTISQHVDDTFEEYDLNGYFAASQDVILDFLKNYLKDQDMLSKELEEKISYQLTFNNYGNQITVDGYNNQLSGTFLQNN